MSGYMCLLVVAIIGVWFITFICTTMENVWMPILYLAYILTIVIIYTLAIFESLF